MMDPIITITEAAIQHIKDQLAQHKTAIGFHLSIKKTGCSGYAYVPKLIEAAQSDDVMMSYPELTVYIDQKAISFLTGMVIDYISDKNNLLNQKRLVFINPHEKNRCGCGESFTLE